MSDQTLEALRALTGHVRNTQADLDTLRDQQLMLMGGVQGIVDGQLERDRRAEEMLTGLATLTERVDGMIKSQNERDQRPPAGVETLTERVRWNTWVSVVPASIVMVCGSLALIYGGLQVLRAAIELFGRGQQLALW